MRRGEGRGECFHACNICMNEILSSFVVREVGIQRREMAVCV